MSPPVATTGGGSRSGGPAWQRLVSILCGAAGIGILWLLFWPPIWSRVRAGDTDFQHFYVGGMLVFQHKLYAPEYFQEAERAILGHANPEILMATRPPYISVLFWPFARLPYQWALIAWMAVLAGAALGFIWLWPDRRQAALACCWSAGLSAAFANAQDLPLILLWLAIALRIRNQRPFLAGLVLSLCAAKFHIFVFLPLLVWRHRIWKGFLAGAAGLAIISFAAAGWDWPLQYMAALRQGSIHPSAYIMPNLHGLFSQLPHAGIWEAGATLLVAGAVFVALRHANFELGLAVVLAGGLLVSYHAYLHDGSLLLPAILIALRMARGWALLPLAWLLAPISGVALLSGHWMGDITRLAIAALLIVLLVQVRRQAADFPVTDMAAS